MSPTAQRISVIIPAKDQAPFIRDALASLERQVDDLRRLEVLVVDDGSSDGTGELAAGFQDRLPGLQIIRNETPRGLATARNQGLDASTGHTSPSWTATTGWPPDTWPPAAPAWKSSTSTSCAPTTFVSPAATARCTGRRRPGATSPWTRARSILPATESTMVDYPYAWAGMFHRRVAERGLLRFPDGLHTAEDRAWIWRLHLHCDSYAVTNAPGSCTAAALPPR